MIKLTYKPEEEGIQFSPVVEVTMKLQSGGTYDDLLVEMVGFLRAIGYNIPVGEWCPSEE